MIFADLHIHSRFSRGCSTDLSLKNLEKYARIKGMALLGTGDFQHPEWQEELKKNLKEDGSGILRTGSGFPFILSTEISLIYSQGGSGRRVHLCMLAPSFEVSDSVTEELKRAGRVDYDGRPIFKFTCPEFVEKMMAISKDIEIFPAHIWTPWFSMFGSNSGFDSVKDCFQDQSKHIHSYETGLSSDPEMNACLSQLDGLQLLSSSDTHSFWPWRIGREATIFDTKMDYRSILSAIRTGEGLDGTIEVDPGYGKYHYDGHRGCNVVFEPKESNRLNKICPVCRKPLTIGVLNRVEELRDRSPGEKAPKKSYKLIPLSEVISAVVGKGIATKNVWEVYNNLLKVGKDELDVMLNVPYDSIQEVVDKKIADIIMLNRAGKIKVTPGYDGVYGVPVFDDEVNDKKKEDNDKRQVKALRIQKGLDEFF